MSEKAMLVWLAFLLVGLAGLALIRWWIGW